MLYVKFMSDQSLSDNDTEKNFVLVMVEASQRLEFRPDLSYDPSEKRTVAVIVRDGIDEQVIPVVGNVYIMNSQGKTIATHSAMYTPFEGL